MCQTVPGASTTHSADEETEAYRKKGQTEESGSLGVRPGSSVHVFTRTEEEPAGDRAWAGPHSSAS